MNFRLYTYRLALLHILILCTITPSYAQMTQPAGDEEIKESETEINVRNAEIASIVRIFSKKTKRNYILDERVKGKVTIYLPGKVSSEESLRILESVLMLKGFTSVPIGENLWKIIPAKEAKQTTIPTLLEASSEGSASPALVTRLLNLKYVNAEDMQQLLNPLISPDGLLNAYGGTNSLVIIDSEENIRRLEELVSAIDISSSEQDMTMIPIKNADAKEIADKLGELLGLNEKDSQGLELVKSRPSTAQVMSPPPIPGGGSIAAQQTSLSMNSGGGGSGITPRSRAPKILADERTNSIIVVADDETTARVKALISQLDSKIDKSGNRFYVYRCQHAKADELADVISGLSGGGSGSTSGSKASFGGSGDIGESDSMLTSGRNNSRKSTSGSSSGGSANRLGQQSRRLGESRLSRGSSGIKSASLGEDISITADPATNSLIIFAGKTDYEKIVELLKQLDIKRRQVLVEATLLEVLMTDQTDFGTSFLTSGGGKDGGVIAQKDFGDFASLLNSPQSLSGFSAAVASAGSLKIGDSLTLPSQAMLVKAAQSSQNANVLSAPQILTTDNEQAEIVVGQNVPFVTSTSRDSGNLDNTFNQIERQDVGITLRLTPQISSESFVTLNIFTEVSSVVIGTIDSDKGPTTNVRTSETTVISKDGQMIAIGGLISDDVNESTDGVPFFKDIPVVGHLFKGSTERFEKRNLLIFITPRIVRDQFDARDSTKERTTQMSEELLRTGAVPDRSDVLTSSKLDSVTESEDYSGPLPSTIIPPEKESKINPGKLPASSSNFSADSPGVIQLKIKPKLEVPAKKGRFMLLTPLGDTTKASLPFIVDSERQIAAIMIPEDSSSTVMKFFEPGSEVSYQAGSSEIKFSVTSAIESEKEAHQAVSPSAWYQLSPHELLNIGKGPWRKSS